MNSRASKDAVYKALRKPKYAAISVKKVSKGKKA